MTRILFDPQIFRKQRFGGISRYFSELIAGINRHGGYRALPSRFYADNTYLTAHNLSRFNWIRDSKNFTVKAKVEKLILKEETQRIQTRLKKGKFEVFHPTYYNPHFLKYLPKHKPFVLTVHDMIHEAYHDNMYEYLSEETRHKITLIPKADHIIAVSQHTKNEILKYFPKVSEGKISVIHHGTSLKVNAVTKKPAGLPDNYLLFIGIKKHYKNFFWLAKALKGYLKQNDIALVCGGGFDFDEFEINFINELNLKRYIKHIAINTDEDVVALFENAACFIFPSLAEGFGIPILEAFACECPVILANSSCFPEVAGDAALYFEPGSQEDLIEKISIICQNKTVKAGLVNKGLDRLKQFSWENTVAQHLKIYDSLIL